MVRVQIIMGRYLPGFKDGGPVRSIANLVEGLGDDFDFRIMATDRDSGDLAPYPNARVSEWNLVGKAKVFYVRPNRFDFKVLQQLSNAADVTYICGCFNLYAIKTLLLKRVGIIKTPVVVASMGLFSPGAFKIKAAKKKAFMHAANIIGLFRNIYWSVSSPVEKADLLTRVKTDESHVFEAGDIPAAVTGTCPDKIKGNALRVVWFSRVSREKNLLGSIEILSRTKKRIHFNIIGPIEDEEYWRLCQSKLADLRSNVSWSYEGPVLPEDVADRLRKQDVFLFPTLGENYGHVIHEALAAGCPCLISDKTPWRDLEAWHAGFTIGLQDYATYAKRLDWFADMKPSQFKIYVRGAFDFVSQDTQVESRKDAYRVLLTEVSSRGLKMKKSVKG